MISNVNNSGANLAYANNTKSTNSKDGVNTSSSSQKENEKVEKLKESIDSGEYKVDLSALANKMADELL